MPSGTALSWELGIAPQTIKRKVLLAGAAIFYGARCLAASMLSKVVMLEKTGRLKVEGVFTFLSYDETPMQVRSRNSDKMKVPDAKPATSKLLQKELTLAILTRPLVAGNAELVKPKFDLALLHLPCPVHLMQRGTGEVTKLCLDEELDVPFFE